MSEKKPFGYWTYDRCFAEAKKYKFKADFKKNAAGAYNAALSNGWYSDYDWLKSRSLTKWTYETCFEEAKKYQTRYAFEKKAGAAYRVALQNNWLDEYTWFVSIRRPVGYWAYETCFEEAKKYKTRSEFARSSVAAYEKARKNGWLDEYTWFDSDATPAGFWTYERCLLEAKKYKTKNEFLQSNGRAYRAAYRNNWLNDYTWFEPKFMWTYEKCYEVAKQYKTKREFEKGRSGAYVAARKRGWLKDYTWMVSNRVDVIIGKLDNVYSYYFEEYNAIYIGRTIRPRRRDCEHIFNTKNDAVARFALEHKCPVPPMLILEEKLSLEKGQEREDYWVNYYKERGYFVLNSAKTGIGIGSLGTLGGTKWTKEKCFKEAQKYKYRKEFQRGSVGAYTRALRMGWLEDYTWFNRPQNWNQKWDEESCYDEALKYQTTGELKKEAPRVYELARKNKWLEDYVWLEDTIRRVSHRWTYDVCYELAKKFKTKSEFQKKNRIACQVSRDKGWVDDFVWLKGNFIPPRRQWDYDSCYEEAKKYKTRSEFEYGKGSGNAYVVARKHGWIKDYTWFEERQKPNGYWTYERCFEEAKKYTTRTEFQYGDCGTRPYKVARANGWLEDYTWFKEVTKPSGYWTYERCAEESKKYSTRAEFKNGNQSAYTISNRNGWMKDFVWLKTKKIWTYEECKEIASHFSSRSAFKTGNLRAYNASHSHKWMDDFFPKNE